MDKEKESIVLTTYFPALDSFRFIAVSLVLFGHWVLYRQFEKFNIFIGFAGVSMFFTLSGFLIARILLVQRITYWQKGVSLFRSFYIRRILRIFPLYYMVLIAGIIFAIPGAREAGIRLATFTLNIPDSRLQFLPAGLYVHFWSLSAEEQFYFAFPLLLMLTPVRFLRYLFWGMVAAGLVSRLCIYLSDFPPYDKKWAASHFTLCCLDSFGMGALLAWYYCYDQVILKRLFGNTILFVAIFLSFTVLAFLEITDSYNAAPNIFLRVSFSACCFWFIGAVLLKKLPKHIDSFLAHPQIVFLGKISYGIYVFHFFMPWMVSRGGLYHPDFHFSVILYAILYTCLTVIIAILSWKYFERPINSIKSRFPYKV